MHQKLSHLSEEEFSDLLEHYYDPDREYTVSEIIKKYKIDARASELTSLLPNTIHDELCPYCVHTNLISKARSRTALYENAPSCPKCKHKAEAFCRCKNCIAALEKTRKSEKKQKRNIIRDYYDLSRVLVKPVTELTLRELLFLKAVLSHKVSEDFFIVDPFATTQTDLAPTSDYQIDIIRKLYSSRLIAPSPTSKLEAFDFDEYDGENLSFYLTRVDWVLLPGLNIDEKKEYISQLEKCLTLKSESEEKEVREEELAMWREIVKWEAIEYFEHKVNEVGVQLGEKGPKTHSVFEDLSNRFSVSQIYHVVFTTTRNTNDFAIRKGIPKYQVKNMFIGAIEKNANKYEAEGWLKHYGRDFQCPQTTLSSILFDGYFKLGNVYFETKTPID